MLSIFLLIPLSLMLFVVAIWAVRYAVKSNQFEDLDNASQRIILDDRQERRQTMQAHENATSTKQANDQTNLADTESVNPSNIDSNPKI
ncbi:MULTISPECIES: cbb3-type cytochrome oxidase assembly protein CcoS [Psychrobacter]|uniref:Cbb3-type cytochrome oxidase maturation protein n=1 Tax=Psychrobacter fozii TaxID=198480 RepID=A0A2V4UDR6_9GAMM|nr:MULTISPECIES: cbb3-type cytochrome oxidase assembly protein CcoS [Psychrobacter]MBH0065385.1 cbb3-type cytochrome oxidase assembly protein CcoS [Psychrobacter sp. SZ93C1]PYE38293.1 cbb3-type cytochrome oxidase maturation protein [Psychrobacter fozii]